MKIPVHVYEKNLTDVDSFVFFALFDEPKGAKIIEVGAHDEPVANVLMDQGYSVTGFDIREYHAGQDLMGKKATDGRPCNYQYVRADFCDLPKEFMAKNMGTFDTAVSLSAVEHFGLGTYGEGPVHYYYDVIALRTIWQLLRVGGTAYVTVPYGKNHHELHPHWRIYNRRSIQERLVQDFRVDFMAVFMASFDTINGRTEARCVQLTWEAADDYQSDQPHVFVLMKLRKSPVSRMAPDGR